jgi:hypothetical protein
LDKELKMKVQPLVIRTALGVVLAWGGLSVGSEREKVQCELVMKFEKGRSYYTHVVLEQRFEETILGIEQTTERVAEHAYEHSIVEVDKGGSAWIKYDIKWAKVRQDGSWGEIAYNSRRDGYPSAAFALHSAALVGESYWVKLTPRGEVTAVKGLDRFMRNVREKLPESEAKGFVLNEMGKVFCFPGLKKEFEEETAIYPEEAVGIGDSWSKTLVESEGIPLIREKTWTLKGRQQGVATVEGVTKARPNREVEPKVQGGRKISFNLSGEGSDLATIQESTGEIVSLRRELKLYGQKEMEFADSMYDKASIPMTVHTITTFETVEREIKVVQEWLGVIEDGARDVNDVLRYTAAPFSFDGKLVSEEGDRRRRFDELRGIFNRKEIEITYDNYKVLGKCDIEGMLNDWDHKDNYEEIADRVERMVAFEMKHTLKEQKTEHVFSVYVGMDEEGKIISWFD